MTSLDQKGLMGLRPKRPMDGDGGRGFSWPGARQLRSTPGPGDNGASLPKNLPVGDVRDVDACALKEGPKNDRWDDIGLECGVDCRELRSAIGDV